MMEEEMKGVGRRSKQRRRYTTRRVDPTLRNCVWRVIVDRERERGRGGMRRKLDGIWATTGDDGDGGDGSRFVSICTMDTMQEQVRFTTRYYALEWRRNVGLDERKLQCTSLESPSTSPSHVLPLVLLRVHDLSQNPSCPRDS